MVRIRDRFGKPQVMEEHPDATRKDVRKLLDPWMQKGDTLAFYDDQYPATAIILPGGCSPPLDIYAEILEA